MKFALAQLVVRQMEVGRTRNDKPRLVFFWTALGYFASIPSLTTGFKLIPQILLSADSSPWSGDVEPPLSATDGLPIRASGPWIDKKHKLLTFYGHLFATGMENKWDERVYLELFSGPGRCFIRDTNQEDLGSPLKMIGHEFTKFILSSAVYQRQMLVVGT